jgi:hypothetical protein
MILSPDDSDNLNKSNKVLFVKIKKYLSNSEQRNLAPQK